jgi:hypothetical protein
MADEQLGLLGLEHPLVQELLARARDLGANGRGLVVNGLRAPITSVWQVKLNHADGGSSTHLYEVRAEKDGAVGCLRFDPNIVASAEPCTAAGSASGYRNRQSNINSMLAALRSYLTQTGVLGGHGSYSSRLLAWLELPSAALN